MEFIQTYAKELFSLLVPAVTWLFNRASIKGPKLIRGTRHQFNFHVNEPLRDAQGKILAPSQNVQTASVVIHNSGGVTCTNVELVFSWKPMCINVWPVRHFDETTESDGRYTMLFRSLAPTEFFSFEVLSVNGTLPALVNVRCDQCVAKEVQIAHLPKVAAWKLRVYRLLMLAGLAALAYIILLVAQFLIVQTPLGLGG